MPRPFRGRLVLNNKHFLIAEQNAKSDNGDVAERPAAPRVERWAAAPNGYLSYAFVIEGLIALYRLAEVSGLRRMTSEASDRAIFRRANRALYFTSSE
jgi:hypothetical protein